MRASLGRLILLSAFVGVATIDAAQAQQQDPQAVREDVDRLRQELESLRLQYAEQLRLLEAKIAALQLPPGATTPEPVAPVPPGAAVADGPQGPLPVYGNVNALSKIFNPDLAVIGNFTGAAGRNPLQPLPPFDLREVETSLQAVVDPYARADFFLAVSPEGIEIEEGYITFPTLPGGLLMKAGKMRSAFGKVNRMHAHVLPWTDRPLMTEHLLGGDEGLSDAGISVARLLPNPWIFLEATGEVYRGGSTLFHSYERRDLSYVGHLRGYQDVSESSNVELGTSFAYGSNDAGPSASTRIIGLDGTFRYRPLRRAIYRGLLARTEVAWSRRSELGGVNAVGGYVAAEYQFARRWFAGARVDHSGRPTETDKKDNSASWLLTYWPSEFSQIRGQFRRTSYAERVTANEFLFQFLFSIGAHGAHAF